MKTLFALTILITTTFGQSFARSLELRPEIVSETLNLYPTKPHSDIGCNVATELKVGNGGILGRIAKLEKKIVGSRTRPNICPAIFIFPNTQIFSFKKETIQNGNFCKVDVYSGRTLTYPQSVIKVLDFRNVMCRRYFPNQVEVTVTDSKGVSETLFYNSNW